jgi:hypothetical protein
MGNVLLKERARSTPAPRKIASRIRKDLVLKPVETPKADLPLGRIWTVIASRRCAASHGQRRYGVRRPAV